MKKILQYANAERIIGVAIIVLLLLLSLRSCFDPVDVTPVSDQAQKDTLQVYKDKLGQEHAKNITIVADLDQFKKMYFAKDSDYRALQTQIDKNTVSAILLRNNSTASITTGTTRTYKDTILVRKHDTIQLTIFPTYSRVYKSKWFNDSIVANKDSIFSKPIFFNEYMITQRYERKNLFHKKYCYVDVTSKNPYTSTTALKSFSVAPPNVHRTRIAVSSAIIGIIGGIFLSKKL